MPKDCPACGVTNMDTAILCDCGWSFAEGRSLRPIVDPRENRTIADVTNESASDDFSIAVSRLFSVGWFAIKCLVIIGLGVAAAFSGFVPFAAYVVTLAALKYLLRPA